VFRIIKTPGPAAYNLGNQTAAGSTCDKYRNNGKVKIELDLKPGPKKYDRIPSGQKYTPGPANYAPDATTSIANRSFKKNVCRSNASKKT
jgi:hypothetical protein